MLKKLLTLTCLTLSIGTNAASLTWTLSDVNFSNGSVATGSFDFDRDTNIFANINISLSAGTGFEAQTFDAIAPSSGNKFGAVFTTLPLFYEDTTACDIAFNDTTCGTHAINISVSPDEMTNAGGILDLPNPVLMHCGSAACNEGSWAFNHDYNAAPGASISTVPTPAAAWLFGSALLTLAGIKRRKASI